MRLSQLLKAKIHHARVTYANPDYVGSIEVDRELMEHVGLRDGELVHVWGVDHTSRIITYCFAGPSGVIGLNGGAAHYFKEGDKVLATGSGLSETRDGGYGEYVRLPAAWTVPLPSTLTTREAMIIGTAGFTAALALLRMSENRQTPEMGPIAITGATGGVGMLGIDIFSRAGYDVHAISGKPDRFEFLRRIGASQCVDRHELAFSGKPMDSARYGGLLDNVGGETLAGFLPLIAPYGNAAICGLAGSPALSTTVMPFIIRGVSVLGIASAGTARDVRDEVWKRLAGEWKPRHLDVICTREIALTDVASVFETMLAGGSFGRTLVRIAH